MSTDDTIAGSEARDAPDAAVPRMTEDALLAFVLGCCDGRIFTSAQVSEEGMIPTIFMPIAFGALQYTAVAELGIVWEYLSEASPRSINGLPCFFSMHLMHKEDWAIALPAIRAELGRRREIKLDGVPTP